MTNDPVWIKLSNGETIVCRAERGPETLHEHEFVAVAAPMSVQSMRAVTSSGLRESYILTPWRSFVIDEVLHMRTAHVLVCGWASQQLAEIYAHYDQPGTHAAELGNLHGDSKEDMLTAQELLQQIMQSDEEEDEEDDNHQPRNTGPVLH